MVHGKNTGHYASELLYNIKDNEFFCFSNWADGRFQLYLAVECSNRRRQKIRRREQSTIG